MSVALRTITRLQDADDINVSLGAGVDEYALCWDNDTAKFVLRQVAGVFLLATGATVGATSQAQAFTNGIVLNTLNASSGSLALQTGGIERLSLSSGGNIVVTGKAGITATIAPSSGAQEVLRVTANANSGAGSQWASGFFAVNTVAGQSTVAELDGILTALYHSQAFTVPKWEGLEVGGCFVDGASAVVTEAVGLNASLPTCTNGGTVGTAAAIKIAGGATTGITTHYALWSTSSSTSILSGPLYWNSTTGPGFLFSSNYFILRSGSAGYLFRNDSDQNKLTLDTSGNAVFSGTVRATAFTVGTINAVTEDASDNSYMSISGGGALGVTRGGGALFYGNEAASGSQGKILIRAGYPAGVAVGDGAIWLATGNAGTSRLSITSAGKVGVGTNEPAARLHVSQADTSGAVPALLVEQLDVSEEMMRFVGTSTTTAANSLVDAADLEDPGAIVGWVKIYVQDNASSGSITDGVYYVPFYAAPTHSP